MRVLISIFILLLTLYGSAEQLLPAGVELSLIGDGHATLTTQMKLTNTTDQDVKIELPAYTLLENPERQNLMLRQPKALTLKPSSTALATVPTLCVGSRAELPPNSEPCTYTATSAPEQAAEVKWVYERAEELKRDGSFPGLPIPPAMVAATIAQFTLWEQRGDLDRDQLQRLILSKLNPEDKDLTPDQEKEVERGADNIWEAVDLCKKSSQS